MNPSADSVGPMRRLLIGHEPWPFLGEIVIRTLIVYLALMLAVRLLGKRMSGQITNLELAVMITLGAIVAVPMETSDRGIFPAVVLLASVLSVQASLSYLGVRSRRLEQVVVGKGGVLVKDGTLLVDHLRKTGLSQQQLFSALRTLKVRQLGEIQRVYLEGHGAFSIVRSVKPKPGLSILPTDDSELQGRMRASSECSVCAYCGNTPRGVAAGQCENCGRQVWQAAVSDPNAPGEAKQ
jgi:uncharacterized membrane protein YcaP (DUF421 family)